VAIGPGVTFLRPNHARVVVLRLIAFVGNKVEYVLRPVERSPSNVDLDHAVLRLATHWTPSSLLAVTRRAGKCRRSRELAFDSPQRGMSERPAA
jgi:hypothetical protein